MNRTPEELERYHYATGTPVPLAVYRETLDTLEGVEEELRAWQDAGDLEDAERLADARREHATRLRDALIAMLKCPALAPETLDLETEAAIAAGWEAVNELPP